MLSYKTRWSAWRRMPWKSSVSWWQEERKGVEMLCNWKVTKVCTLWRFLWVDCVGGVANCWKGWGRLLKRGPEWSTGNALWTLDDDICLRLQEPLWFPPPNKAVNDYPLCRDFEPVRQFLYLHCGWVSHSGIWVWWVGDLIGTWHFRRSQEKSCKETGLTA